MSTTPITFIQVWKPAGFPTQVTSATIGIYDNTTASQVVANGTAMDNTATGTYQYTYTATEGHTYTAAIVFIPATGGTITYQQVVAVPASTVIPATTDDGSSAYISGVWAAQRGLWTNIKNAALSAVATALANGEGPSYSISGRAGSESLSFNEFLMNMRETAAKATEEEITLTQALQDVSPFDVRHRVGIGRRGWRC